MGDIEFCTQFSLMGLGLAWASFYLFPWQGMGDAHSSDLRQLQYIRCSKCLVGSLDGNDNVPLDTSAALALSLRWR